MVLTVSLETGFATLAAHSQHYLFRSKLAASWDPSAYAPNWLKATRENMPHAEDQELLKLFGASVFIPDSRWETTLCLYGISKTGKSTITEGLEAMLGEDACKSFSMSQICDPDDYNAPELAGALLNISTELRAKEFLSDRWKQWVSGETIPVRRIYGKPFQVRPHTKFIALTNHLPKFKGGTDAELRRLRFVSLLSVPAKMDNKLKARIRKEGNGILTILVSKIKDVLALEEFPHGSEQSQKTRTRFEVNNDPVGAFVKERCVLSWDEPEDGWPTPDELLNHFKSFLDKHQLNPALGNEIYLLKQLYDRFPVRKARLPKDEHGVRLWVVQGIALAPSKDQE